jgi:hypothetical protein
MKQVCECCGRTLNPAKIVQLELDQRIGEYHDFGGVPESQSQGWFEFGSACAVKARAKARQALQAIVADAIGVQS